MSNVVPFPSNGRDESDGPESIGLREALGDVLRDERRGQERTLGDVAREAAVSLPYLSEVERGRKDVSSDVLSSICDALDVPLPEVLERTADRLRIDARSTGSGRMTLLAA